MTREEAEDAATAEEIAAEEKYNRWAAKKAQEEPMPYPRADDIADLLDDMAALGQHWERNRQSGRMPAAIRLAMISTAEDILSATFISESNAQTDDLVDALKAEPRINGQGRIKTGSLISQDHGCFRWPICRPPHPDKTIAHDPDMEFDVQWNGKWWTCKAPGYGAPENYGNGSIHVMAFDDVVLSS